MDEDLEGAYAALQDLFAYHAPTPEMQPQFKLVAGACEMAARTIIQSVPRCPERTLAIRALLEARMQANAGIVSEGRFRVP